MGRGEMTRDRKQQGRQIPVAGVEEKRRRRLFVPGKKPSGKERRRMLSLLALVGEGKWG